LFPSIHETINETSLFRDRHPDRSNVKPVEQEHIGVTLWASVNLMPVVFIFFPQLVCEIYEKGSDNCDCMAAWDNYNIKK
jgi:hypothetical protein